MGKPERPTLLFYASLADYHGTPVLVLRKVIMKRDVIHKIAQELIASGYMDVNAKIVVRDPLLLYERIKELKV